MLLKRPRPGKDVDWTKVAKTTVSLPPALPQPSTSKMSPKEIQSLMSSDIVLNVPAVPRE